MLQVADLDADRIKADLRDKIHGVKDLLGRQVPQARQMYLLARVYLLARAAEVASSRKSHSGFWTRARAKAMRCCSPGES